MGISALSAGPLAGFVDIYREVDSHVRRDGTVSPEVDRIIRRWWFDPNEVTLKQACTWLLDQDDPLAERFTLATDPLRAWRVTPSARGLFDAEVICAPMRLQLQGIGGRKPPTVSVSIGNWARSARLKLGTYDWDRHYTGTLYELYGFLRFWAKFARDGLQAAAENPLLHPFNERFDHTDDRALALAVVDQTLSDARDGGRGWYGTFGSESKPAEIGAESD